MNNVFTVLEKGEHNIAVKMVTPGKVIPKAGDESINNPSTLLGNEKKQKSRSAPKQFATKDDVERMQYYTLYLQKHPVLPWSNALCDRRRDYSLD